MNNLSTNNHLCMEQHQRQQKTFDIDAADPGSEPDQVVCNTSIPPPLVRPDRQII